MNERATKIEKVKNVLLCGQTIFVNTKYFVIFYVGIAYVK